MYFAYCHKKDNDQEKLSYYFISLKYVFRFIKNHPDDIEIEYFSQA